MEAADDGDAALGQIGEEALVAVGLRQRHIDFTALMQRVAGGDRPAWPAPVRAFEGDQVEFAAAEATIALLRDGRHEVQPVARLRLVGRGDQVEGQAAWLAVDDLDEGRKGIAADADGLRGQGGRRRTGQPKKCKQRYPRNDRHGSKALASRCCNPAHHARILLRWRWGVGDRAPPIVTRHREKFHISAFNKKSCEKITGKRH